MRSRNVTTSRNVFALDDGDDDDEPPSRPPPELLAKRITANEDIIMGKELFSVMDKKLHVDPLVCTTSLETTLFRAYYQLFTPADCEPTVLKKDGDLYKNKNITK